MSFLSSHLTLIRPHLRAIAVVVFSALLTRSMSSQSATASEDDLRAAMVSHLPLFVEWPATRLDALHPQLHICLLGADPIAPVLEAAFRNASTSTTPTRFSHVSLSDKLDDCHLLYVGAGTRVNVSRLLPTLTAASVLVVSERPIDILKGEIIGLPLEDNHVRIEVNLAAVQSGKLTISSKLLRLAAVVRQP